MGSDAIQPAAGMAAPDLRGVTPAGGVVEIAIGTMVETVLVAFLTTRCDGCDAVWQGLGGDGGQALPPGVAPIIVTRGTDTTAPTDVARLAAGCPAVPVVMSDAAWADYRVFGYPFFVLIDPTTRTIVAEAVAFGWDDLIAFVRSWVG